MERQRQLWRKEQSDHEQILKERDALLKKTREREEEEYQYQLVQRRRKEKETLFEERQKQERELQDRSAVLAVQEQEVGELRRRVGAFPAELEQAVRKQKGWCGRRHCEG